MKMTTYPLGSASPFGSIFPQIFKLIFVFYINIPLDLLGDMGGGHRDRQRYKHREVDHLPVG
jgi:hypothetical protein